MSGLNKNADSKGKYGRQEARERGILGRLWMSGRTKELADVNRSAAAQMYRADWDGCRTLWKAAYRQMKARGLSTSVLHR